MQLTIFLLLLYYDCFVTIVSSSTGSPSMSYKRDCRQVTFVTIIKFCPLPPPLFLTDKIKMDGIPTKIKWKLHSFFTLYLKF